VRRIESKKNTVRSRTRAVHTRAAATRTEKRTKTNRVAGGSG
jgi:hypothetical protein